MNGSDLIPWVNLFSLHVSAIMFAYFSIISVMPVTREEKRGEKAWKECYWFRIILSIFASLMVINTIVALIFGIAFVLVPGTVVSLYGVIASPQLLYTGQLFGAALIGFGVLTWLARNLAVAEARKAILPAHPSSSA